MARYDFLNEISETQIFKYYEMYGENRAASNVLCKLRMEYGLASKMGKASVKVGGHIKGGKVTGNIAKDNWLPQARITGGKNSHLIEYTCPHCDYSEDGPNIFKNHFDNCIGLLDVFEFNGEVGNLVGTYNNQSDIFNDFPTMSKSVLCQAVNGKKKAHHPNFVGGYVVIPKRINKLNQ